MGVHRPRRPPRRPPPPPPPAPPAPRPPPLVLGPRRPHHCHHPQHPLLSDPLSLFANQVDFSGTLGWCVCYGMRVNGRPDFLPQWGKRSVQGAHHPHRANLRWYWGREDLTKTPGGHRGGISSMATSRRPWSPVKYKSWKALGDI